MSNLRPLLERNRAFAATGAHAGLAIMPRRPVFLVTCLDPRVDPAAFLGIELGDAPVIRNAGGRVTEAVINDIGLQLPTLIRALSHAGAWPVEALAVAGTLIATRVLWVFPLSAVIQRRSGTRRPSLAIPAVVSWAGTRGVVPLAAALSIPLTTASGAPLAQRDLVLVLAAAVIVISLIVQGLTLEPLARFAGITRPADARHEETIARLRLAETALARLDELADDNAAPDTVIDRARASLQARIGQTRARGTRTPEPDGLTERELRRELISAENAELARLYQNGTITAATRQRLQHNLDLEATRLSDDHR